MAGLLLAIALLTGYGQTSGVPPQQAVSSSSLTPETFLSRYGLRVKGSPLQFPLKVPANWQVPLGAYPAGLYWGLANVFSQDVGLDLRPLKGQTVEIRRYPLTGGLPGQSPQSGFSYPSDVILVLQHQKVVGAWLSFNRTAIGPSVRKRTLQDITGLSFGEWIDRQGYFADVGNNGDMAKLGPGEVLQAFCAAINTGNETRANACMSPEYLLNALTVNMQGRDQLYNPDFTDNNSLVKDILQAKLISYKLYAGLSAMQNHQELKETGNLTRVLAEAIMEIKWRDAAFNTPNRRETRSVWLEKRANGWKMDGLATGP